MASRLFRTPGDGVDNTQAADEELAKAQEAAAYGGGGEEDAAAARHSALVRMAQRVGGGPKQFAVKAAKPGRVVAGPAATESARADAEATAAAEAAAAQPVTTAQTQQAEPVEAAWEPSDAEPLTVGSSRGVGVEEDPAPSSGSVTSDHLTALGHLLRSSKRTLLLLPAAEALTAAMSAAEAKGLPKHLSSQLRALLPYLSAREAERLLADAAMAADGAVKTDGVKDPPPLKTLRVAGSAQKAAHARGYLLILVINDAAPWPRHLAVNDGGNNIQGSVASRAAAAGSIRISDAMALQLDRPSICRLRTALGRAPLHVDMSELGRSWRIGAGEVHSGAEDDVGSATSRTSCRPHAT